MRRRRRRESFIYFSIAISLSLSDVFSSSCYFIVFYVICSVDVFGPVTFSHTERSRTRERRVHMCLILCGGEKKAEE